MYKFNVSALGRMFLLGEHEMWYRKTCVAASLDIRTTLAFTSLPIAAVRMDFIEIDFSSIRMHVKIPLRTFFTHFYDDNSNRSLTGVRLREAIEDFINSLTVYKGLYKPENHAHRLNLQAFFYLLVLIGNRENISIRSSFIVKVSTELAIGEGLGSSASFAVCLAACFWRWSVLQKGTVLYEFGSRDLTKIMNYAQICKNIIFDSPSSIDTIITVYGSTVAFRGDLQVRRFADLPPMNILLVFSNVKRKTSTVQRKIIEETKRSFTFINSILNSIDAISQMSTQILNEIVTKILYQTTVDIPHEDLPMECYERLSDLIRMNQGLLSALGLSHPNLNTICAIAQNFSLAGNLMGNGGGGNAFILLFPNSTNEIIDNLLKELKSHDFPAKIASLSCSGVRVE